MIFHGINSSSSISNLSPPFIFALTETAFLHQAPALIDTIFKHLALQTYMGVNISVCSFTWCYMIKEKLMYY